MTSGPDPGELPGFWGSMVFRHAPIPRKGSGKQQQQVKDGLANVVAYLDDAMIYSESEEDHWEHMQIFFPTPL